MQRVLEQAIQIALESVGITDAVCVVERPADLSHGDYATNAALAAAKKAGKNPRELAETLAAALQEQSIPDVERIEIAGAGFINFHLSRDYFKNQVAEIVSAGALWGNGSGEKGKKVLVEYTSPNLFKPLHIGNLMSNIIGESIARLFEVSGAEVKRVNYPSDIGLTVAKAVWGLASEGGDPTDIHAIGRAYQKGSAAYEEDETAKVAIEEVNKKLYEKNDESLNHLREEGIATSRKHLKELCTILGTEFDIEIFESESGPLGKEIVTEHVGTVFSESDGAIIFKGEEYGLHTRVFINSKGLPTYEAKDVGLIALKRKVYPFDLSLTTTALEQEEYFKVVIKAIEMIFPDLLGKVEHLPYGFLSLTTGKMSSRKGNVITGESLINEMTEKALAKMVDRDLGEDTREIAQAVAVAAIKYMVLKQGTGKNIVFDPEQSLSFEGDSGPYLQYAHARSSAVLRKAEESHTSASIEGAPENPYELERVLGYFPNVVERALIEREPHHIATYLTELAGLFNSFYATERITDATDGFGPYRVALTEAVKTTLHNGLSMLGIKALERM